MAVLAMKVCLFQLFLMFSKAPLLPIPEEGAIDFTKRIRNVSVRYLNSQTPTKDDLDKWVVLPLYQMDQVFCCLTHNSLY